jgi:signal transduction histidine kinase
MSRLGEELLSQWRSPERRRIALRATGVAVITVCMWLGRPVPGLQGRALAISVTLAVAVLAALGWIPGDLRRDRRVQVALLVHTLAAGVLVGLGAGNALAYSAVACLTAGEYLDTEVAVAIAAVGMVGTAAGILAVGSTAIHLALVGVPAGAVVVGFSRRERLLRLDETELRLAQATRAQEEATRAARLAERSAVAREIHDVLAHSLGALVLQLDALEGMLAMGGTDPEDVRRRVERARSMAQDGLREARRAVGALREDNTPVLESLRALADQGGDGQAPLSLQVEGQPRSLSSEATVALLRTAQESVTNARRYAPDAPIAIRVRFDQGETVLTIRNDAPETPLPPSAAGGGYGIGGLRERAELIGATLTAGPEADGGWKVTLRVPA